MTNLKIEYPETPEGKRSIRQNIYGNIVGYVGGRRFWEFGDDIVSSKIAEAWANGMSLEEANLNW